MEKHNSFRDGSLEELLVHLGRKTGVNADLFKCKNIEPVESAVECPACGELYFKGEDARVDAGLKCGRCAYPF
jgi:hypothetical protein